MTHLLTGAAIIISPLVKHLLKHRKKLYQSDKTLPLGFQDTINALIRDNQRLAVLLESRLSIARVSRAWWTTVSSITGRKITQCELISTIIDPDVISEYFCGINTDPQYASPTVSRSVCAVTGLLNKIKRTACGPDELPFWFWRDYAYDLALVITDNRRCPLFGNKLTLSVYRKSPC